MANDLTKKGYVIIPQLCNKFILKNLQQAITKYTGKEAISGIRNLHHKIPEIKNLIPSKTVFGTLTKYTNYQQFQIVKAIFFNKNLDCNWAVAWHQDKTIAVKQKANIPEYKNWTIKQGVPHVQPPTSILEKITTIRIALDDANCQNGALKIIPESHKLGILTQLEIDRLVSRGKSKICSLKAGDALIMHPLLLHSSSKSTSDRDRRTIHLEYSSCNLPQDLDWYG